MLLYSLMYIVMGIVEAVTIKGVAARRLYEEARKRGMGLEEYVLELVVRDLDPKGRAGEYIRVAQELLGEAGEELKRGNNRQAAEKIWGAAALAVEVFAFWREGKRLASHGELWEYSLIVARELGGWVRESWFAAVSMHTCFYEGWCRKEHIEEALKAVRKLVERVAGELK